MKKAVLIFDCDGVLVDSEIISIAVNRKHLAKLGLNYSLEEYQSRFVGCRDADILREHEKDYRALGLGQFPSTFAAKVDAEEWATLESDLKAIHGAQAFFDDYSGKCAVASSSTLKKLHKKLKITNLFGYFAPHIYSGEQVPNGKPSADLFLMAASKLGEKPGDCIVIEDSVNGVRAGVAAGMEVWGFLGGSHADQDLENRLSNAGAHKVVSEFSQLS